MGQDKSRLINDSIQPDRLASRTVKSVAKYIKDGKARRIIVMTGAGISTSAGIPDFRSPDTGLYANLARLELPYAEAVFDISYFRTNPDPFYTLAHELYPGKYRPTITHSFISLLHDKGLLLKLFTQNIDCLEREAGLPPHLIVEAHGSFATQTCIDCKAQYPDHDMKQCINDRRIPYCKECGGLVKPDIIFFGESLPLGFFESRAVIPQADLIMVMGTSLSVAPFSSLPQFASDGVPRLLVNMEQVGDLGSRADDVVLLEDCDRAVRQLATELGWIEQLESKWTKTAPEEAASVAKQQTLMAEAEAAKTKVDKLQDQVNQLAKEIDHALKMGEEKRKDLITAASQVQNHQSEHLQRDTENVLHGSAATIPQVTSGGQEDCKVVTGGHEDEGDDAGGTGLAHVFEHLKSHGPVERSI